MKLGKPVRSTTVPLYQPSAMATTNDKGMAIQRLSPAPPSSPTSLTSRIVTMPRAPVAAPDDRSNSPPIINIATATAMMPSVAETSRTPERPPAVPNWPETAQKNAPMAAAPTIAPISGRTSSRAKTPRYARRSSSTASIAAVASPTVGALTSATTCPPDLQLSRTIQAERTGARPIEPCPRVLRFESG